MRSTAANWALPSHKLKGISLLIMVLWSDVCPRLKSLLSYAGKSSKIKDEVCKYSIPQVNGKILFNLIFDKSATININKGLKRFPPALTL